jgi:quercetin dioxygenase-like cupin family protein
MPATTLVTPAKRVKTIENSVAFGNAMVSVLVGREDTGGSFSMMEVVMKPGTEPPYHVHEHEDEIFYLLEGRVSVMLDGTVYEVMPGETIFLPRQVPHTFRIRSEVARTILTVTPSGFEEYFRSIGHPVKALGVPETAPPPPDFFARVAQVSARHGVRIMEEQPVF